MPKWHHTGRAFCCFKAYYRRLVEGGKASVTLIAVERTHLTETHISLQGVKGKYVGAYRIRPDVSDQEMIAVSKLSLKPCRAAQQGFHARKSVAAKRSKVSMLVKVLPRSAARFPRSGKRSPRARQGFPVRENVPHERGKVFPLGKTFPRNRARFSRLGKCSPRARQGFPARESVPHERGKVFPLGKVFPTKTMPLQ